MSTATERPEIGTVMYSVHEHRYYVPEHPAPVMEYCICEGKVTGFFKGGYTEVKLLGENPDGFLTPYFYPIADIGRKVFYTRDEAIARAARMTDDYEKIWGWIGSPKIPMRRPWRVEA